MFKIFQVCFDDDGNGDKNGNNNDDDDDDDDDDNNGKNKNDDDDDNDDDEDRNVSKLLQNNLVWNFLRSIQQPFWMIKWLLLLKILSFVVGGWILNMMVRDSKPLFVVGDVNFEGRQLKVVWEQTYDVPEKAQPILGWF